MSNEFSAEDYRRLANYMRDRRYRDESGNITDEASRRIAARRAGAVEMLLRQAKYERTAKKMRPLVERALAEIMVKDDALVDALAADDAADAARYDAKAEAIEAKRLADVIPLNTAAMRQAQHIAESVAKSEAKREAAAATCSDHSLESNLRASVRASNNDSPKGAA